jgi:hypothetical protein
MTITAASENRNTPETQGRSYLGEFTVKDAAHIYTGAMVALDTTSGEVEPAADAANLVVLGRATAEVDNADDGLGVLVEQGIFRYANSGSNALARTDIGSVCYVEDDLTVGSDGGTNDVVAGLVYDVDADGVWVVQSASTIRGPQSGAQGGNAPDFFQLLPMRHT